MMMMMINSFSLSLSLSLSFVWMGVNDDTKIAAAGSISIKCISLLFRQFVRCMSHQRHWPPEYQFLSRLVSTDPSCTDASRFYENLWILESDPISAFVVVVVIVDGSWMILDSHAPPSRLRHKLAPSVRRSVRRVRALVPSPVRPSVR